jgi:phosphoglycerate dehydrogenase-like enzyme
VRIAVLDDYQHVAARYGAWERLDAHEVVFFHEPLGDEDAVASALADFDVVCAMRERTPFTASLISRLPRLKLLVTTGMWNAAIDLEATEARGLVVCGTEGLLPPTPELTWGLILALARHIPAEDRALREGTWQTTVGTGLSGKTLGVLGLGNIGTSVAAIGAAFGMRLIAWSENLTEQVARAAGAELVTKDVLFRQADVLTIHLRLSERTRGLVGADELASMKRDALLVNTSRGPIVDEDALVAALERGLIAGAALDVYGVEPLPLDHPLRRAPNTVLTPHLGYVTEESYAILYGQTVEDVLAYADGEPIRVLTSRAAA